MPALKMKAKPSCGGQETFLTAAHHSRKISKNPHHQSYSRVTQPCQSVEEKAGSGYDFASQLIYRDLAKMDSSLTINLEVPSSDYPGAKSDSDASTKSEHHRVRSDTQMPADSCDDQIYDSSYLQSSYEPGQRVCEVATAAPLSDEPTGLDDVIRISFFQEFECAEPDLIFDVTENCILLSSLDEQPNAPVFRDRDNDGELLSNSDNSWFHLVAHQSRPSNHAGLSTVTLDAEETDSFDAHLFIRNFLDLSDLETNSLPALLPNEACKQKRATLVLDLDETLIHSTTEPCEDADFTFKVFFSMEEHTVYVRKRPYLKTFLERVSEIFDIVIFTASESVYASQLLDMLDPERKFFSRRVYRESCIVINGNYTKDLTVLGVDLARCAIVDNCPQVFQLQVSNGIPIPSWFDDPSDRALMSLLPFLETLADAEDVRPIIAKRFGLERE